MLMLNISVFVMMCLALETGEGWLFQRRSNSGGSGRSASESRSVSGDSSDSSGPRSSSRGSRRSSRRSSSGSNGLLGRSSRIWTRQGFLDSINEDREILPGYTRDPMSVLRDRLNAEASESIPTLVNRHLYTPLVRETEEVREANREMERMLADLRRSAAEINDRMERERLRERIDEIETIDVRNMIARHDGMCALCMSMNHQGCINAHCSRSARVTSRSRFTFDREDINISILSTCCDDTSLLTRPSGDILHYGEGWPFQRKSNPRESGRRSPVSLSSGSRPLSSYTGGSSRTRPRRETDAILAGLRRGGARMNLDGLEEERLRERIDEIENTDSFRDTVVRHDSWCSFCMSINDQGCIDRHCSISS